MYNTINYSECHSTTQSQIANEWHALGNDSALVYGAQRLQIEALSFNVQRLSTDGEYVDITPNNFRQYSYATWVRSANGTVCWDWS